MPALPIQAQFSRSYICSKSMVLKKWKRNFLENYNIEMFDVEDEPTDFKIVCSGFEFNFHKKILGTVSAVFKAMIENETSVESQTNKVIISDFLPDTIMTFMMFLADPIDANFALDNFDIELLRFSDKYLIAPLAKICEDHLIKSISSKNVLDLLESAHIMNNSKLFDSAILFIGNEGFRFFHLKYWKRDWRQLKERNPDCFQRMIATIEFKGAPSEEE